MARPTRATPTKRGPIQAPFVDALSTLRSPVFDRTAPAQRKSAQHQLDHGKHVLTVLQRHSAELVGVSRGTPAQSRRLARAESPDSLRIQGQAQLQATERLKAALRPAQPLAFVLPSGTNVLGPPFDLEWQAGTGWPYGSINGDSLITLAYDGFTAAGVGFYVSSPQRLLAAITPMGSYRFNWFVLTDEPALRSRGGLGLTVYLNGNPAPVYSRQAVLWSISGGIPYTGEDETGAIATAASPAFGLGPVPLAPVYLELGPARQYLIWVWCWQVAKLPPTSTTWTFLRAQMPFAMASAGPIPPNR